MSRLIIQLPRKIRPDDYPDENKEAMGILGNIYNTFVDDVYRSISTPDTEIIKYTVNINAGSGLINPPQIKANLSSKIKGLTVINSINLKFPNIYPISYPFISWTIAGNGLISIQNITGLQANSQYELTIQIIT